MTTRIRIATEKYARMKVAAHAGEQAKHIPDGGSTGQVLTKTADGTEWKNPSSVSGDAIKHADFAGIDPNKVTIAQLATILKGLA